MSVFDTLENIKSKIKRHKKKAHPVGNCTPSAILIPLIVREDEIQIVFTERTERVRNHKGQISFPGGVCEKGDITRADTALREAKEELGYPLEFIKLFGEIDDYITITGYHISPFVGYLSRDLTFVPDPVEIKKIFCAPIEHFKNPHIFEIKKFEIKERIEDVFFFKYKDKEIWGATAKILKNFFDVIELGR